MYTKHIILLLIKWEMLNEVFKQNVILLQARDIDCAIPNVTATEYNS
jgi:hypothetical protein